MVFAGAWSSSVTYAVTDVVTFNGSSYIAIAGSTNQEPDLNPNTWMPLALAGAAGPTGATGPAGPSGGTTVNFPITIPDGGTGAITAPLALAALGAAAKGANVDITSLGALGGGMTIGTPNPGWLSVTNGIQTTTINASGIDMTAGILCSSVQVSSDITTDVINPNVTGAVSIGGKLIAGAGLEVQGSAPTVASGQLGIGASTFSTATAGGGASLPSTVLTFLEINVGGVLGKIPVFAV